MRKILEISKCYPVESLRATSDGIITCCAMDSYLDAYSNIHNYIPNRNVIPVPQTARLIVKCKGSQIVTQSSASVWRMAEQEWTPHHFESLLMAETIDMNDDRLICYSEDGKLSVLSRQLHRISDFGLPSAPRSLQPMSIQGDSILVPQNHWIALVDLEYQTIYDRFLIRQPTKQLLSFDSKLFFALSTGNVSVYDIRSRRNIINMDVSEDCSTIRLHNGRLFTNGQGNIIKSTDVFQKKTQEMLFPEEIHEFWLLGDLLAVVMQNPCRLQLYSS